MARARLAEGKKGERALGGCLTFLLIFLLHLFSPPPLYSTFSSTSSAFASSIFFLSLLCFVFRCYFFFNSCRLFILIPFLLVFSPLPLLFFPLQLPRPPPHNFCSPSPPCYLKTFFSSFSALFSLPPILYMIFLLCLPLF